MVDRLLTGLIDQQKGTTARWYSNKTSLLHTDVDKNATIKEFIDCHNCRVRAYLH